MKQQGKVLTSQEIMENRNSKYEFIDFKKSVDEGAIIHCKMIDKFPALENPMYSFKQGAKWQAKRSYSEEEVWNILLKVWEATGNLKSTEYRLIEPFEQFKKK